MSSRNAMSSFADLFTPAIRCAPPFLNGRPVQRNLFSLQMWSLLTDASLRRTPRRWKAREAAAPDEGPRRRGRPTRRVHTARRGFFPRTIRHACTPVHAPSDWFITAAPAILAVTGSELPGRFYFRRGCFLSGIRTSSLVTNESCHGCIYSSASRLFAMRPSSIAWTRANDFDRISNVN